MQTSLHHGSHLTRYREIASVLTRHGLGFTAEALGLTRFLPLQVGAASNHRRGEPTTEAEHLRLALEDLGATFIKLGQILSTRPDIVPVAYQQELAKLQDGVPPVSIDLLEATIESKLGQPVQMLFATFDRTPLAAASIGQVHAATLPDGTDVVVKIRRPGVNAQVNEDLEILMNLAERANRNPTWSDQFDFVGLAQEFADTLRAELDYVREAANARRFAKLFADDATVRIPRIFENLSTSRILTIERERGLKEDDVEALDAAGIDRKVLARRLADLNLTMVFQHGFFHADPHPGTFFIEPNGRVVLIDFGMVGEVSLALRHKLGRIFIAVEDKDSDRLVDAILEIFTSRGQTDRTTLQRDFQRIMDAFYREQLGRLGVGNLLQDVMSTARAHHLRIPSDIALLFKTWIMIEGLVAKLDPTASMAAFFSPYVKKLVASEYSPAAIASRMREFSMDFADLSVTLPRRVNRILNDLENGRLTVAARPTEYEPILDRFETLTNRSIIATIAAAFVVGLAIVMVVYHPLGWERWIGPAFAFGVGIATSFGAILAYILVRKKQR